MKIEIYPGKAKGRIMAPPSKSMAHRLIICAGLAAGESVIEHVDLSQDILATLDCLRALGADVKVEAGSLDQSLTLMIKGTDIRGAKPIEALPCRECGSTLRFFVPLCLLNGNEARLTGSSRLFERPLTVYEDICSRQNLFYKKGERELLVAGRLKAGIYQVPGNISSQFISGLLFALPLLEADSKIRLIPPVESRPYIDMTLQALTRFGIKAKWEDELTILVSGNQNYQPARARVEGDYSNAAFFEALNLIGGQVRVEGLDEDSLQGDKIYRQYFKKLESGSCDLDISDCPDLGPVLIAAAALKQGARFLGTRRLKIKESDRGLAMKEELGKMGLDLLVTDNEIIVPSGQLKASQDLKGHGDHRIVMALSVILTQTGGTIEGAQAVNKSFPDFFDRLSELGIKVIQSPDQEADYQTYFGGKS